MFGVVPKPLWERTNPPDERNRIDLAMRGLLIETEDSVVLVDCGAGSKMPPKLRDIYAIREPDGGAEGVLARAGLRVEDVTHLIISHLHFDHAGGCTVSRGGRIEPAFPRATFFVQRRHLAWARAPSVRDRASFFAEDFEPLAEAGVLRELDGPAEVLPGVRVEVADGHTPGLQVVFVEPSDGPAFVFPSDVIPTASHLPLPYVMGYDLEPLGTVSDKRRILEKAATHGHRVVFEHDPMTAAVRIGKTQRGYEAIERLADPVEFPAG